MSYFVRTVNDGISGLMAVNGVPENKPVIQKLIRFSLAMVTVPVGIFLVSYYAILDSAFLTVARRTGSQSEKLVWSAVFSVIAVNAIIVMYILSAFAEDVQGAAPAPAAAAGTGAAAPSAAAGASTAAGAAAPASAGQKKRE
eukprot:tig00000057_g52.t1